MKETTLLMNLLLLDGCAFSPKGVSYADNTGPPHTFKPEEVRILMSANDPATTKLLNEFLHARNGQKYFFLITEIAFATELLHHEQKNHVDIFIFVVDNILFTADTGYSSDNRIKEMLDFVSFLKRKYKKPVIAIEGWPNDPAFGEEAKSAGADFFFRLPFEGQEFQEAVEWCILDSFNRQKKYIY